MRKAAEIREAFADRSMLDDRRSFFLVGIGGAGMSALARMLSYRGFEVVGTDSTSSPETDRLMVEGITVCIGHSGDGIEPRHALVLTDAIDLENSPEVARARELGVPLFRRSQVLGWLLRDRKVIAVTGTHGKTTTTGMIGAGLRAAGLDPLIVVGAAVPEFGGPVVEGKGEWAVVEACEAYDSFHDIDPRIVVLTNLELDHVDFHGTWENLKSSVVRFIQRLPEDGWLTYAASDEGSREAASEAAVSRVDPFAVDEWDRSAGEYGVRLLAAGLHNRTNAAAALKAATYAGANPASAARGIANFLGAERRLQVLLEEPVTVIDDYAHHPTEISASLSALNERYPYRRLVVVYQPHLYSRTEPLIAEFATALSLADLVVLTDIYPAREAPIPGVSSARIAEMVTKPVMYVPNRHLLPRKVAAIARAGDVVVGMGAGNIAEFTPLLVGELARLGLAGGSSTAQTRAQGRPSLRVAVVYGGDSAEREVSLLSGREVAAALKGRGHDVSLVDVSELLIRSGDLSRFTGPARPDVVFLAVHGTHAEDGATQGLFELLHLPYTGSDVQASAIAMNKQLTKSVLRNHGIRVPEGVLVTTPDDTTGLRAPLIVKPNAQGSTVGLSFVERDEEVASAIGKALQYDSSALVEEWIVGMEVSAPVLGDRPLPPVEIAPAGGRYDFASKYTPGATEEIVPARLAEGVLSKIEEIALTAHRALGCAGATRTDMIVREGEVFALEVNTLPGMTATSLLPNSARAAGIEFDELCEWLLEDALKRYAAKA